MQLKSVATLQIVNLLPSSRLVSARVRKIPRYLFHLGGDAAARRGFCSADPRRAPWADDPGLVGALTCTGRRRVPLDNEFVPVPRADHFSGSPLRIAPARPYRRARRLLADPRSI
ncbi:MAG TPA: hypothetical protein VMV13_12135 [Candidatus Binataceae bacterium]|nr:hypothetical protein [Candidatus Binataceae bacterium]